MNHCVLMLWQFCSPDTLRLSGWRMSSPISRPSVTTSTTTSRLPRWATPIASQRHALIQSQAYIHTRMRRRTADFLQGEQPLLVFLGGVADSIKSCGERGQTTKRRSVRRRVDDRSRLAFETIDMAGALWFRRVYPWRGGTHASFEANTMR